MMIWHKKHKFPRKKGDLCAQISRTIDNIILLVPSKRRQKPRRLQIKAFVF